MNDIYPKLYAAYRWLVPPQLNIADVCVHRWAGNAHEGKNVAVYGEDETGQGEIWTYARVSETARRLANGLQKMLVAPGDRVAIVMAQRPEAIVALVAVLAVGAVAVPLPGDAAPAVLRACLRDACARVAIVDAGCAPAVHQARDPHLKQMVGLDFVDDSVISWRTLLARQSTDCKTTPTACSDSALCLYGQESGAPSGVVLPHAALIGALPGFVASQNWFPRPGDIFWSPDWYAFGHWLGGVLAALYFGCPVVAAPNGASPQRALALLARYKVSNASLPDSLAIRLAREPGLLEQHADDLALRALAVQGLPLPADVLARYQAALGLNPNHVWSQAQAIVCVGESHLRWPGRAGSLGRAYPGHRVAVIDDHGQACATGTVGMLAVHRYDAHQYPDPVLSPGGSVRGGIADGWIPLGLRARMDAQGYVWPDGMAGDA